MNDWMETVSPFVRVVKIIKSKSLAGEWIDFDHVFTYIEQGEAEFILNGVKYTAKEGDIFLMPPFLSHIIRSTSDVPLIQYIVHFDLHYDETRSRWKVTSLINEETEKIYEKEMTLSSVYPVVQLRTADRIDLKKRFLLMQKVFLDDKPNRSLLLKAICLELLGFFIQGQMESKNREGTLTKGWGIIEKTINYIQGNYSDPELDNQTISEHVGVSTSHLSFLFKEQLNITIHKYVTYVRIEQAKLLIVKGEKTLTVIANEVGYSSIHPFSRSFKAETGLTPSQYYAVHSNIRKIDKERD
ncbi:AraC family transcriptional regulator [Cohnella terricola]|uniref:AraC family transcriptional regulator n=1 Tax=Cohnella terricola TaxID=1289167 RepID=A0A559JBY6_9BACL|nr:AraC family transcriptional regulator [Cohnella terricola]TVX97398.1 AraC family transcriptional regulator [Cohnella terricola]